MTGFAKNFTQLSQYLSPFLLLVCPKPQPRERPSYAGSLLWLGIAAVSRRPFSFLAWRARTANSGTRSLTRYLLAGALQPYRIPLRSRTWWWLQFALHSGCTTKLAKGTVDEEGRALLSVGVVMDRHVYRGPGSCVLSGRRCGCRGSCGHPGPLSSRVSARWCRHNCQAGPAPGLPLPRASARRPALIPGITTDNLR